MVIGSSVYSAAISQRTERVLDGVGGKAEKGGRERRLERKEEEGRDSKKAGREK